MKLFIETCRARLLKIIITLRRKPVSSRLAVCFEDVVRTYSYEYFWRHHGARFRSFRCGSTNFFDRLVYRAREVVALHYFHAVVAKKCYIQRNYDGHPRHRREE